MNLIIAIVFCLFFCSPSQARDGNELMQVLTSKLDEVEKALASYNKCMQETNACYGIPSMRKNVESFLTESVAGLALELHNGWEDFNKLNRSQISTLRKREANIENYLKTLRKYKKQLDGMLRKQRKTPPRSLRRFSYAEQLNSLNFFNILLSFLKSLNFCQFFLI